MSTAGEPPFNDMSPAAPTGSAETTGASVARGSLWETAGLVLPQIYVVIGSVFVARYLGPAGVGRLTLIAFVQVTVTTGLVLGLPVALTRYAGELVGKGNGGAVRVLARWAWKVEIFTALAAFLLMTGAGLLGADPQAAWLLAGVSAAGAVMHAVPSSFLRGLQRWREARIVGVATGGLALGIKIVALMQGGGIVALFAIDVVITAANLLGTVLLARRAIRTLPPADGDTQVIPEVVRFAALASVGILITLVVYQRTEVFFLARYSTDSEIAIYSIPFSIVSAMLLLPRAIAYVLAPAVANLWGAGEMERIRSSFSRATRLVVLLNLLLTGVAAALLPAAIRLVYGSAFASAGRVLVILVATLPFVPLTALGSSFLLGIGRQWGLTIVGGVAALTNIGLDFALIPRHGAIGAAVANSIAQLVGSIPLIIYASRVLGGLVLHVGALLRGIGTVLAAIITTTLVIHVLPLGVALPIGSVVFVMTLVVVGIVARPLAVEDAVWVEAIAGTRLHGLIGAASRCASGRSALPWVGGRE